MREALIVVDMQNAFIDGSLGSYEAKKMFLMLENLFKIGIMIKTMQLEDEVNNYIAEGWKPIGSICVVDVGVPENHNEHFIEVWQPMILEN